MAKKSKCRITLEDQDDLLHEIERLGGNIESAIIDAVELSGRNATNRFKKVIEDHKISGITEEALVLDPKADYEGKKIVLYTGFDLDRGGAPALWLDRGTPTQKPLNYVKKIKKEKPVINAIGYVLGQEWRKLIK